MSEITAEAWDSINQRRSQEDAKNLFNALAEEGSVTVEGGGNTALKEEREEKDQPAPAELIEASAEPAITNEGAEAASEAKDDKVSVSATTTSSKSSESSKSSK